MLISTSLEQMIEDELLKQIKKSLLEQKAECSSETVNHLLDAAKRDLAYWLCDFFNNQKKLK